MLFDNFYMPPDIKTARKALFSYLIKQGFQLRPNYPITFQNGLTDAIDMLAFKEDKKYAIILGKKSIRKRYKIMFDAMETREEYTKIVILCGARLEDDSEHKDGVYYINVRGTAAYAKGY